MTIRIRRLLLAEICGVVILGSVLASDIDLRALSEAEKSVSTLVEHFITCINKGGFEDAQGLLRLTAHEQRQDIVSQYRFLAHELGNLKAADLPSKELRIMERQGLWTLTWGAKPKLAEGEYCVSKAVGVRFGDGAKGVVTGTIVVGRGFETDPSDKPLLVKLELAAPKRNHRFHQVCQEFAKKFAESTTKRTAEKK